MKFSENFIDERDLRDFKIKDQTENQKKDFLTFENRDIDGEQKKLFISNISSRIAFLIVLPGYFDFFYNLESYLDKSWLLAVFLFSLMALLHFACDKSLKFIISSFMEIRTLGSLRNWQEYHKNKQQNELTDIEAKRNLVYRKELGGYYSILDKGRFNTTEKQTLRDKRKQLG